MNKFEKRSMESYNRKAKNYEETFDGKFTVKFKEKLLEELAMKKDSNILDVACGNGKLLSMIADKFQINGYGSDISQEMINNAKLLNPSMTYEVASCTQSSFEDEFFDVITVCAAYHHFPDVNAFAKEAARLLKNNGYIYIAEVYYPAIVRAICNPFISLSKAGDVKFYSPKEIVKTFESEGFIRRLIKKEGHIQLVVLQK